MPSSDSLLPRLGKGDGERGGRGGVAITMHPLICIDSWCLRTARWSRMISAAGRREEISFGYENHTINRILQTPMA